jgi:hypothetical protein
MAVTIHDHFSGSANCLECRGFCTLVGDDLAVTKLVRFTFEQMQRTGIKWSFIEDALQSLLGPRTKQFYQRSAEMSEIPKKTKFARK